VVSSTTFDEPFTSGGYRALMSLPRPDPRGSTSGATPENHRRPQIRLLIRPEEFRQVDDLLERIWHGRASVVPVELLTALARTGGYVAGAFVGEHMVGVSVGFLARHDGRPALHSHVTGIAADARDCGVGRALKRHQRDWALEQGLDWITWTFDPLVRRNAWFNIAVLGATVRGYEPNFYGVMDDAINAGDESDRLVVAWDVATGPPDRPKDGRDAPDDAVGVPTPPDVVELRRTDPAAVARWRTDTRRALTEALASGRTVVGFTREGEYLIGSAP
jgi:predicted GNAT superfamily acetyltransferase